MPPPASQWPACTPWPRTTSPSTSRSTSSELCQAYSIGGLRLCWLPALPAPHHPLSPSAPPAVAPQWRLPPNISVCIAIRPGNRQQAACGCTHRTHQCIVVFTNHSNTEFSAAVGTSTLPALLSGKACCGPPTPTAPQAAATACLLASGMQSTGLSRAAARTASRRCVATCPDLVSSGDRPQISQALSGRNLAPAAHL